MNEGKIDQVECSEVICPCCKSATIAKNIAIVQIANDTEALCVSCADELESYDHDWQRDC